MNAVAFYDYGVSSKPKKVTENKFWYGGFGYKELSLEDKSVIQEFIDEYNPINFDENYNKDDCNSGHLLFVAKSSKLLENIGKQRVKISSNSYYNVQTTIYCMMYANGFVDYIGLSKKSNLNTVEDVEFIFANNGNEINLELVELDKYYLYFFGRINYGTYSYGLDENCISGCGNFDYKLEAPNIEVKP